MLAGGPEFSGIACRGHFIPDSNIAGLPAGLQGCHAGAGGIAQGRRAGE
jgi:hypothetical protein